MRWDAVAGLTSRLRIIRKYLVQLSNCYCAEWTEGGVDAGHARHKEHFMMEMGVTVACDTDDFSVLMSTQNTTQESKLGSEEQHSLSVCYIYDT
jgi:hypothetical protein